MRIRDGPAAVRGDALPPTCHWPTSREGGGGGSPESEDLPRSSHTEPLAEGGFVLRRSLVLVAALGRGARGRGLGARAPASPFGWKERPRRSSARSPVKVDAGNALRRSTSPASLGEFYYRLTHSSFGDYVSQIGRYPAAGSAGWVFKVNGVSPPVGADQVALKDGDSVLWYCADVRRRPAGRRRSPLRLPAGQLLHGLVARRRRQAGRPCRRPCCTSTAAGSRRRRRAAEPASARTSGSCGRSPSARCGRTP